MTTDVVTVKKQIHVMEAVEILLAHNVTGFPVVNDDGTIAGIISEKDMLGLISDSENASATVEDFLTKDIVSFDVKDDLIEICECLINNHFRRVPIVKDGKLVGVVSRKNLIKYILDPI